MTESTDSVRPPLISVALLSAALLGYEVLLMRAYSIMQWHHFAYMIISLALLGLGASGTVTTLCSKWLVRHFPMVFIAGICLFGVSALASLAAIQGLAFNPQELLWGWRQLGVMTLSYLLLAVPFFFGSGAIVIAILRFRARLQRVYGADLIGAGAGGLSSLLLLGATMPEQAIAWCVVAAFLAAAIAMVELQPAIARWWPLFVGVVAAAVLAVSIAPVSLVISPYKDLNQILQVKGTRVLEQHASRLGVITVVESPEVPLRIAPGLSLTARHEPPPQLGLFVDGDGLNAINRHTVDKSGWSFLALARQRHRIAWARGSGF